MAITKSANVAIGVDARGLRSGLKHARTMFGRTFNKISGGIASNLKSALSPLALGGGAIGLAAVGRSVMDFESTLGRLQIQSGASGSEINKFRSELISMSKTTGISRTSLVNASNAMVNLTGKTGMSIAKLKVLADAHDATGASMDDLAGLTMSLKNAFGINSEEGMRKGLSGIIEAGKQGSITLGEMSSVMQGVAGNFAELGVVGTDGVSELASALQVLRANGFKTAETAGTGLEAMMGSLAKKASKLRKHGIEVFDIGPDGIKNFKSMNAILDQIGNSELIKDPELMINVFGRKEGAKAALQLIKNRKTLNEYSEAAKKSNSIDEDAAKRREQSGKKVEIALNKAKEALAELVTPERIKIFADGLNTAVKALGFMVDHAKMFVAAFAAFKMAALVSSLQAAATASGNMALSSKSVGKNIGGYAGALGSALIAGAAFGAQLDEWFGISDEIADNLNPDRVVERTRKRLGTAGVYADNLVSRQNLVGIGGHEREQMNQGDASMIQAAAKETGFFGADNKIDYAKLSGRTFDVELIKQLANIEKALAIASTIEISMDPNMKTLIAHAVNREAPRRSPQ